MTIREFRSILRNFEREIAIQNNDCCNTGVSLVQCHLLLDIERKGDTSVTELSEIQGLDKSTVSRTVDTLFNKGLINRDINPQSRRQSIISLTEEGKKTCNEINEKNDSFFEEVFSSIHEDELNNFISAFAKIAEIMKKRREYTSDNKCCS